MTDSTGAEREVATVDELTEQEPTPGSDVVIGQGSSLWLAFRVTLKRLRIRDEYLIGGIILVVICVSLGLFFLRGVLFDTANISSLGYVGVFLFTLLGSATIFLPSGGGAVVILAGAVLNPVWVGLVAGLGGTLGETTGYFVGYEGGAILERHAKVYTKAKRWMERRGSITIFVLSVLPNPIFDAAGLAAGGIRFPLKKFLMLVWIGKTIQAMGAAFLGAWGSDRFISIAEGLFG